MVTPKFSLIRTKAKEANVRTAATAIQLALESHYLTHRDYPQTQPIEALLATLQSDGALRNPKNPFTQTHYTASDSSGQLVYTRTDTGYTLTAYGHNNTDVLLTY
jgi:type II secretory pathway pseudopilin PulG